MPTKHKQPITYPLIEDYALYLLVFSAWADPKKIKQLSTQMNIQLSRKTKKKNMKAIYYAAKITGVFVLKGCD